MLLWNVVPGYDRIYQVFWGGFGQLGSSEQIRCACVMLGTWWLPEFCAWFRAGIIGYMFLPTGWKPSERFRHFFICSLGWGGVITFTYLRTPMMLRHGTFTCTCAHTSCYVEDVSRHAGVGWGGVITFTYLRTIDSCWRMIKASVPDQLTSCPENEQKLNDLIHLDVRSHMAVAMGGKCSWKSPVGENRCVLSEDVEITGKNGCRWGFGHADFPKGTFFALRHVNYIQ